MSHHGDIGVGSGRGGKRREMKKREREGEREDVVVQKRDAMRSNEIRENATATRTVGQLWRLNFIHSSPPAAERTSSK